MRKITVINQKGGTGKTTTAVNLGAALSELGREVLLVDLDPQAGLTESLGVETSGRPTVSEVLTLAKGETARPERGKKNDKKEKKKKGKKEKGKKRRNGKKKKKGKG